MKIAYNKLLKLLSQKSTWKGFILVASACGATVEPSRAAEIISAGIFLVGLINVVLED